MNAAPAWVWPILMHPDGRVPKISSGWGEERVATEAQDAHIHQGADIMYRRPHAVPNSVYDVDHGSANYELAKGSPVLAAGAGVVAAVGTGLLGTHVTIAHTGTGLTTFYQHLEKAYVRKGQRVAAGQQIGIAGYGSIGSIRHLHFQLGRWNGSSFVPFDPEPTLKTWPVLKRPVGGRVLSSNEIFIGAAVAGAALFFLGRH